MAAGARRPDVKVNAARIDESEDQWQIVRDPREEGRQAGGRRRHLDAHGADHDLQADELQRDVRHRRDQPGHRHGKRQPAVAEAAAHEIGGRDVAVLPAHRPQRGNTTNVIG